MATKKTTKAEEIATPKEEVVIIPKEIDDTQYVTVRNGFHGVLVYVSKRTGEKFIWDEFGAEQDMELRELKNVRSSSKQFFTNNWFMFDEDWIPKYLGVDKFYKNTLPIDEFDSIFEMKPKALEKAIANLSDGQRMSAAYRASELIAERKIDSLSVIETLERALGVELMEK